MMKQSFMSSDVGWHIRDKLWPMPKHSLMLLYIHRNQKAHYDRKLIIWFFFNNRYKSTVQIYNSEIPELSEEQQVSLEGEITLEEAGTALKNMKNGKSPGTGSFGAH